MSKAEVTQEERMTRGGVRAAPRRDTLKIVARHPMIGIVGGMGPLAGTDRAG